MIKPAEVRGARASTSTDPRPFVRRDVKTLGATLILPPAAAGALPAVPGEHTQNATRLHAVRHLSP